MPCAEKYITFIEKGHLSMKRQWKSESINDKTLDIIKNMQFNSGHSTALTLRYKSNGQSLTLSGQLADLSNDMDIKTNETCYAGGRIYLDCDNQKNYRDTKINNFFS